LKTLEEKTMKVRISAVISILALAAWLPIQAQQAATPSAPTTQTQTPAAPDGKSKDAAAHGCCHPKAEAGQETQTAKPDQTAMDCCHGKAGDAAKSACCMGKEAKEMACCGQKEAVGKTATNCCAGKQDTMCAAKNGKNCCGDMNTKDGKRCCVGINDHCAMHANGK
jgi:hypothetical protein